MHRTLKEETIRPPARNRKAQQRRFQTFRTEFNHHRPHQALGQKRPAELWIPSPRPFPNRIPEPTYLPHYQLRRVWSSGMIKFKNHRLFLSETLRNQLVALEEIEDGIWSIYFYDVLLGRLDERNFEVVS